MPPAAPRSSTHLAAPLIAITVGLVICGALAMNVIFAPTVERFVGLVVGIEEAAVAAAAILGAWLLLALLPFVLSARAASKREGPTSSRISYLCRDLTWSVFAALVGCSVPLTLRALMQHGSGASIPPTFDLPVLLGAALGVLAVAVVATLVAAGSMASRRSRSAEPA
jgi:hypothetical protein